MTTPPAAALNGHRAGLSVVKDGRGIDRGKAERAMSDLFDAMGVDLTAPDVRDTPRRVAALLRERVATRQEFLSLIRSDGS